MRWDARHREIRNIDPSLSWGPGPPRAVGARARTHVYFVADARRINAGPIGVLPATATSDLRGSVIGVIHASGLARRAVVSIAQGSGREARRTVLVMAQEECGRATSMRARIGAR